MNMIEVKNLVKRYGDKEVVSGLNFTIEKGEVFGLLGPNGAGKSTSISMISGLLKPTSGEIYIGGINIATNPKAAKRKIGVVPQDIALYPTLSAEENLKFWGKMYNIKGSKLKERVEEVLKIANLADKRKERIDSFSGGMKRRINIAAALLHEPDVLIMDEPTVGIDPQSRNHILETVKKLNEEGMTIIYTSHYMEEVEYLCSKIAIVDKGKIIALDEKEALKAYISEGDKIDIKVSEIKPNVLEEVTKLRNVNDVTNDIKENNISIYTKDASEVLMDVMRIFVKNNIKIIQTKIEEPNLENVFLNLTGKALRD